MSDTADLNAAAVRARAAHEAARLEAQASRGRLDGLRGEVAQAEAGAAVAAGELVAWQARHAEAAGRADGLAGRCQAARTAWQEMAAAPDELTAKAGRSEGALAAAEAAHEVAKAELSACEARARALAMALRDGEQRQAACREAFVRTEAASEGEAGAVRGVLARAVERLGEDAALPAAADFSAAAEERARRRLERLSRERDEMGPVNLRADLELAELDERAGHLEREREELGTAIAKLRGSIGHLNREGRERLTAVFTQVDQHFRTLFTRMMGGGRAHLALVGSEDPLSAGLEIYAEPPGKKLSSLALLSGGEQALTALSLIFAVFRCNPAPVSVLDEVDAPLDDANVERFCTLLDDVVRETGTRFLVVTHHQLTMSRMDRLFGVTMQERGVSRLLSVDLRGAVAMVEPVMAAAE
jgi:chromosome segregation protein